MTKGKVHKVGGPAIVPNKGKSIYIPRQGRTFYYPAYYQNNKLHRVDGPAYKTGEEQHYYYNDKRHRIDGPAHYSSNIAHWYKYGMKHRDGHPAEQESDSFWFYDTRHNLDGPAKLDDDDNPCYYILGIRMTKAEWQRMRKDPNVVGMVENTRQAVEEANAFLFTKENIDVDSSTFRSMF